MSSCGEGTRWESRSQLQYSLSLMKKKVALEYTAWNKLLSAEISRGLLALQKTIHTLPRAGTYLSSFMAISNGSVSPSNSTITGAHILGKHQQPFERTQEESQKDRRDN